MRPSGRIEGACGASRGWPVLRRDASWAGFNPPAQEREALPPSARSLGRFRASKGQNRLVAHHRATVRLPRYAFIQGSASLTKHLPLPCNDPLRWRGVPARAFPFSLPFSPFPLFPCSPFLLHCSWSSFRKVREHFFFVSFGEVSISKSFLLKLRLGCGAADGQSRPILRLPGGRRHKLFSGNFSEGATKGLIRALKGLEGPSEHREGDYVAENLPSIS